MSIISPPQSGNQVAQPRPERLVVHDESRLSYLMDTARYEHLYRVASMMARSSLVPVHLKGSTFEESCANCFRIVNQAMRWGFDIFAVADESYVVKGKLGYQGKLVASVVNSLAPIEGRLRYTHSGKGDDRTVTVSAKIRGDKEDSVIELSVRQAKTTNEMWTKDPDQKLCYSGATKWARRFCPEILMGVLTDDDVDAMSQREVAANVVGTKIGGNDRLLSMLPDPQNEPNDGGPTPEDLAGTVDHAAERFKLAESAISRAASPESVESILADEQASGDHGKESFAKLVEAGDKRKRAIAIASHSKGTK